jgi:hypothetical protein
MADAVAAAAAAVVVARVRPGPAAVALVRAVEPSWRIRTRLWPL